MVTGFHLRWFKPLTELQEWMRKYCTRIHQLFCTLVEFLAKVARLRQFCRANAALALSSSNRHVDEYAKLFYSMHALVFKEFLA